VRTAIYAVLFGWAGLVLCSYFVVLERKRREAARAASRRRAKWKRVGSRILNVLGAEVLGRAPSCCNTRARSSGRFPKSGASRNASS
jgi:hypothetical protein